ncbi:MAG TPA: histidine phosphatase family protein [Fibrobacteraceae bacterium]|nr:histidine phosphatase family protein [Fibrobacteraceae bacterium]
MILLRHAPVMQNGLCYGSFEIPVQEVAHTTLSALKTQWEKMGSPSVVSSPASRCLKLAQTLVQESGATVISDPRLREMNFGTWEGRPWSELPRAETEIWTNDWETQRPPQGETYSEIRTRVLASAAEWFHRDANAWFVTHAGPIRILLAQQRGLSPAQSISIPVPYLTPLDWEAKQ